MASRATVAHPGLLLVWLFAGCSDAGRLPIAGRVSLHGEPLASGMIQLEPAAGDGLTSGATIQAGRYEIPAARGLPPGRYRVRIQAVQAAPPPPADAAPGEVFLPPGKDLIPPRYNRESELTAEVTAAGPNEFDFKLE